MTVVVPLSAFFITILVLFLSSLRALSLLRDRLFLVPGGMISGSWILKLSK